MDSIQHDFIVNGIAVYYAAPQILQIHIIPQIRLRSLQFHYFYVQGNSLHDFDTKVILVSRDDVLVGA
jgi:hypothetical protein